MKKQVGEFFGIPVVADESVPEQAARFAFPPLFDPFPAPGEPDRVEVTSHGVLRYRRMTRAEVEKQFPGKDGGLE